MSKKKRSLSGQLAKLFVARAANLGLKGKARDRAALEYIIGAAQGLILANKPDGGLSVFAMLIATGGYAEIVRAADAYTYEREVETGRAQQWAAL